MMYQPCQHYSQSIRSSSVSYCTFIFHTLSLSSVIVICHCHCHLSLSLQLESDTLQYASQLLQRVVDQVDYLSSISPERQIEGDVLNLTLEGTANVLSAATDPQSPLVAKDTKQLVVNATTSIQRVLQVCTNIVPISNNNVLCLSNTTSGIGQR